MRRGRLLAGLLGIVLSLPAFALESLEPPDLDRYVRWGPLRVRPGLRVTDVGYDDNIFFDTTAPVGDYRMSIAPRVQGLVLLGSRGFVTFDETLRYTLYIDNDELNFLENLSRARVTVPLRRIGVFAEARLDRRQERPIDRLDERLERDEDGWRAGLILEPGWRTTIELGFGNLRLRHDDPDAADPQAIADRLDRSERGVTLEAAYRVRGAARLTLFARRNRLDFRAVPDTSSWSVQPGFDFGVGGSLRGSLRAGWSSIAGGALASRPRLSEPVGRAELSWRVGRGLTLEFDAVREPGFTLRSATYFVNGAAGLRAVRYLNRAIGVELGGGIGRLDFPGAPAAERRRDRIVRYNAGVRLRLADNSIGRRIEYGIRFGRWRRSSTSLPVDQRRTTLVIDATLGF